MIDDDFDFTKLECQYYEICNSYDPNYCQFDAACDLRQEFRQITEKYVSRDCLENQVRLIDDTNN